MLRIEHANLCVRDIDAAVRFLRTALPDLRVRGEGRDDAGCRWLHFGNDDTYIALQEASAGPHSQWVPYEGKPGVNHLAFEVDDVEAIESRLTGAGYPNSTPPNAHSYRKRVYFYDSDGNDWEFVQYFSSDPARRNDYDLPDA